MLSTLHALLQANLLGALNADDTDDDDAGGWQQPAEPAPPPVQQAPFTCIAQDGHVLAAGVRRLSLKVGGKAACGASKSVRQGFSV